MDKITVFKDYDGTVGIKIPASLAGVVENGLYRLLGCYDISEHEGNVLVELSSKISDVLFKQRP